MPIQFGPKLRRIHRMLFLVACVSIASLSSVRPAWALKNRTIVLRATGSGAILGLGAGLVSYPFAKSTNTIVAGVAVGAVLGAVYGFYLVDSRENRYEQQLEEGRPYGNVQIWREATATFDAINAEREAVFRQASLSSQSSFSSGLRIPLEISLVAYRF